MHIYFLIRLAVFTGFFVVLEKHYFVQSDFIDYVNVLSCTIFKLEALREHRPPPNASIIELLNDFAMQISYAALIRIVIRNGLPYPDSDADRHQNVISWSLGHTPALHTVSSKSVGSFFDNPVNPDFGHRTSDSWIRTVIRIVTKIYPLDPWAMPYDYKKFIQNPLTTFSVIRRTDKQTDRQTEVKT